ncbi:UDP-glucose 4-epimerase GalE [Balneolales bacterium ANBcel1]|nr:UDP-glucose 4-epimerase GalE [Balneolales bacterium ANBcel1]
MNILVIGGAGYIGSHVVYELNDAGHRVTILDNFSTGLRENLDARATLVEGDMRDHALLGRLLSGEPGTESENSDRFDSVFHFAALKAAGESMEKPELYTRANLIATMELLNIMLEHDVRNFVFSSSAATYGSPEYLPIDEGHPQKPINYYGYTKLVIEQTLEWYSRLRGLRYAALRYFNAAGYDVKGRIHGKEQNPANLLPIVMEVASGDRTGMQVFGDDYPTRDGTCIRDYIHVNDLATAHVLSMEYLQKHDRDLQLNLATGEGYTVLEVIREAEKVSGKKIPFDIVGRRDGDPAELVATSDHAGAEIDWKAMHSALPQLVESMWNVYKEGDL